MSQHLQNFGLIRTGPGKASLQPIHIPKLKDDYILVRTAAIALNPTDWTSLDAPGDNGTLVGCDYSGIVEQVGKAVTKNFKKGDRVAGFGHGGNDANPETGTFARYIAVKGDVQMHIPDGVSFEAAATVGVGVGSAGYALYKLLKLPFPDTEKATIQYEDNKKEPLLVYGGSTATGTMAIQFANMSGRRVLSTSSPRNFDLIKKRGAHVVYDYRTPKVGAQIRTDTSNSLTEILDTVNVVSSATICAEAFIAPLIDQETDHTSDSSTNVVGKYVNLLGDPCPRADIDSVFFLGYSMSGEDYIYEGESYPAQPEDLTFAREWYGIAEKLWARGEWVPHPQRIGKGGLRGALEALGPGGDMRTGKVSGEKLVFRVEETVWE